MKKSCFVTYWNQIISEYQKKDVFELFKITILHKKTIILCLDFRGVKQKITKFISKINNTLDGDTCYEEK